MKSILIIILFVICNIESKSQITYFKYLDYSVQIRQETGGFIPGIGGYSYAINYYFNGDTLINGKWYYKQYANYNTYYNCGPFPINKSYIREDNAGKFYEYSLSTSSETVIFDNAQYLPLAIGNAIPNAYGGGCNVTSIDSILLGSVYLRKWTSSASNTITNCNYIVEGIGVIGSICSLSYESSISTTCYKKQNNVINLCVGSSTNCNWVNVSVKEIDSDNTLFKLFPNPTQSILYFESSKDPFIHYQILNNIGQIVREDKTILNNNGITIDIVDLPIGVYLFKTFNTNINSNLSVNNKKFIISR
jgi:hypothetical protein